MFLRVSSVQLLMETHPDESVLKCLCGFCVQWRWLLNTDSYLRHLKLLAYLRLLFVLPPKERETVCCISAYSYEDFFMKYL